MYNHKNDLEKKTKPSGEKDTSEILTHYWGSAHFEKHPEIHLAVSYKVKHIFTEQTCVYLLEI